VERRFAAGDAEPPNIDNYAEHPYGAAGATAAAAEPSPAVTPKGSNADLLGLATPSRAAGGADPFAQLAGGSNGGAAAAPAARLAQAHSLLDEWNDFESALPTPGVTPSVSAGNLRPSASGTSGDGSTAGGAGAASAPVDPFAFLLDRPNYAAPSPGPGASAAQPSSSMPASASGGALYGGGSSSQSGAADPFAAASGGSGTAPPSPPPLQQARPPLDDDGFGSFI